jgi:hypothetical protein
MDSLRAEQDFLKREGALATSRASTCSWKIESRSGDDDLFDRDRSGFGNSFRAILTSRLGSHIGLG